MITITLGEGTPVGGPGPPGTVIPPGTYDLVFDIQGSPMLQVTGPGVSISLIETGNFSVTRTFAGLQPAY